MDTSKESGSIRAVILDGFRAFALVVILGILFAISGCATVKPATPQIKAKTEIELAIEQMPIEWLTPCPVFSGPPPENTIGALHADFIALSSLHAKCAASFETVINYLRPLVEAARRP